MKKVLLTMAVVLTAVFGAKAADLFITDFKTVPTGMTFNSTITQGNTSNLVTTTVGGMVFGAPSVASGQTAKAIEYGTASSDYSTDFPMASGNAEFKMARVARTSLKNTDTYIEFPKVTGPATITVWSSNSGTGTGRFTDIYANGDKVKSSVELPAKANSKTDCVATTYSFSGTGEVTFKVVATGGQYIFGIQIEGSNSGGGGDEIVTLYDSGNLATNANYIAPDWITTDKGAATIIKKTGLKKDAATAFYSTLGIPSGSEEAYALAINKTQDGTSKEIFDTWMMLNLSGFQPTLVTIQYWGTGGKGIQMTSGTANAWSGNKSYVVGEVSLDVSALASPVSVKLVPTGEKQTDYSTGDAFINRIVIKGKKAPNAINSTSASDKVVVSTQYYNLLGAKVYAFTSGIIIEKSIYEDGTSSSKKVLNK